MVVKRAGDETHSELEPLVTECPNCHTRFRVTESQLEVARGRVRCGACLTVFQGTDHLLIGEEEQAGAEEDADAALDELLTQLADAGELATALESPPNVQSEDVRSATPEPAAPLESALTDPDEWPDDEDALGDAAEVDDGVSDTWARAGAHARPETIAAVRDDAEPVPEEAIREAADLAPTGDALLLDAVGADAPSKPRWLMVAAIPVLVIAFAAQVLWYQHDEWVRDPATRGMYEFICGVFGCELPVMRDANAITSRDLVVRSHPERAGALLLDALIVNEAPFAQPFPVIELRFSSMGGDLVAARRFSPDEYLDGEVEPDDPLEPMTPVHIRLAIEDPGRDAVNYVMVFR